MAWHRWRDLVSRVFGNALMENKTIGWYYQISGQQQLGFSVCCVPHQLLLCCGLRRISSGTNLVPESLHTVCASGTLQGAQFTVANCLVTNKVDCCEEFYSFTNQAFVLLRLGTCQEWWQSSARSPHSAWRCAEHNFCCYRFCNQQCWLSLGETLMVLLPAMMTQMSLTEAFVAMAVAVWPVSLQVLWRSMAMMRGCDQCNQFYGRRFVPFSIVEGCGPVALCGKRLILALHGIRGLISLWLGAHPCLAWRMWQFALVARGSLWPSSTDVSSLGYLPYLPLAMYTPSLAYSRYLPLAYLHCWS